ncbi:TIGR01777 family oxidoreductase [Bacillus sp. S/N-304-OC-R1]|uniref:TIGR01777 family oxidoreductase n=1 Tax=Bacillus sp. S/N-304-OC-R1 TaxID=2758034 RepID=UPI001C8D3E2A|nr:TIGR01777 family oxidoreductase [Bacillus sp. S/N-304-OC-R1]MBY0121857.1 TIGR01777 family protein [Bacillus sp. S/N-304-OC-R1]
MKIALTGGTGFVGRALTEELIKNGHEIFILTRNTSTRKNTDNITYISWLNEGDHPEETLEGIEVIINLAGESINSGRWTESRKKSILKSRISATKEVLRILEKLEQKPSVLINASAIGYYGTSQTKTFTEDSSDKGTDFLAQTVQRWEAEALKAKEMGIRTVCCRFGIILNGEDGALPRIALPYKLFAGGTVGSGEQWVSWIHLKDVVNGIIFAIQNEQMNGPINFTAPTPVKMKEFGQILGKVMHRPHWIPAPGFALKAVLGEMSVLVLEGQNVHPAKLTLNGYPFLFRHLQEALEDIY